MLMFLLKYFSLPILSVIEGFPISLTHFVASTTLILALICFFRSNCVYLVDFSCYLPPDHFRAPISAFIEHFEHSCVFDQESLDLQKKILERSGIGDEASVPIAMHEIPPINTSLNKTREEIEEVLFNIVKDLLSKHKMNPKSIDILISNCSLSCPIPSLAAMVINKFGFRSNVKSINLSGMGCSAGLIAVNLAKDLLKVHKNSVALVLSTEAVTPNGYKGADRSMLLANVLFRMGGAAVLLSNRKQDRRTAKYKLQHLVRTNMASDDKSYHVVCQKPDKDGNVGVLISKALLHVAGDALRTNIEELGPLVLPFSELLRYGLSVVSQKVRLFGQGKGTYVPNFKKAFKHFCIHAGGRAVIDSVEDKLRLHKEDGEASRMTLYRFGNTSSSSNWYELCYLEAKGKVKKGDRVWQISFGSGFKCNSAVWKCISDIDPNVKSAWSDRIHLYPVEISKGY